MTATSLPQAETASPGSWTAADVAGYLTRGIAPRVMRHVLATWPSPADYEHAWAGDEHALAAQRLPRPVPALTDLPDGCWLALAGTPDYPTALLDAPSAPLLLFGRGNRAALRPGLAVVGTRDMTNYGAAVAQTAVAAAADLGVPVHSGAAHGCDRAAHEAALAHGLPTVAVLATGPDVAYPADHADLLDRIVAGGGAIVSEHPFGTGPQATPHYQPAPLPARLMARNRIIAGLGSVLVPAEATGRSGTMGAVWAALGIGRPVIVALPRPGARNLPGAQAPLGLAHPVRRSVDQLTAMGAPADVARYCAGRSPLASGVAEDRDDLTLLVRTALLLSPDHAPAEAAPAPAPTPGQLAPEPAPVTEPTTVAQPAPA